MFDQKAYIKQWHKDNPEYDKQYRKNNKEGIKEYGKQWRGNNPEYNKEYHKKYRENNPGKVKQYRMDNLKEAIGYGKQWRRNNPDYKKKYFINNKEKILKQNNDYQKNKKKTNLKYSLNCRMTNAIYDTLKRNKNGRHWGSLVDYTLTDLIKRLEQTMPEGYTWRDYLKGKLQIDHIIPKNAFNFTKPEHIDFKRCWALSNLRLLPARENLIKRAKLDKPFQPALQIC